MRSQRFITCTFYLTIVNLLVHSTESILFNKFSGRCIYIDKESSQVPFLDERTNTVIPPTWNVYALPCTWDVKNDDGTIRKRSMLEEWMEIIPRFAEIDPRSATVMERQYSIRKIALDSRGDGVCIVSREKQALAVASTCESKDSRMKLEIQLNMTKDQGQQFRILDRDGRCLTVQLGKENLIFRECTRRYNLQQRWLVCRHNMVCDTDVTWSPRKITFKNDTDKPETRDPTLNKTEVPIKDCNSQKGYFQNEVLYSIQNGIQIYESGEDLVVSSIASFFPMPSLSEAHDLTMRICREEKLQCVPCNIYSWKNQNEVSISKWLVSWMEKCNEAPLSSKRIFLSRNVLHVPHFFPRRLQDVHKDKIDTQKSVISSLKKYLAELEAIVDKNYNRDYQGYHNNATETDNTGESGNQSKPNPQSFLTDLDIDVRFASSHKKMMNATK